MFGVGQSEVLLILLAVLILFGAKRIPEVARSIGKGMSDIRSTMSNLEREIRDGSPAARTTSPDAAKVDDAGPADAEGTPPGDPPLPQDPGPGRDLSG